MNKHSKKDRKTELKIRRIEVTSDRLTGRAGLCLFVAYLHGSRFSTGIDRWFGAIRKNRKGICIPELFKQVLCFFVDGTSRHLTYFDQLEQDEGYAGSIETEKAKWLLPIRSNGFSKALPGCACFCFDVSCRPCLFGDCRSPTQN